MEGLRTHGDVTLVVADTAVALADLLDFERGAYVLDTAAIRRLVDAATTADPRYTPSTIRKHMTRRTRRNRRSSFEGVRSRSQRPRRLPLFPPPPGAAFQRAVDPEKG